MNRALLKKCIRESQWLLVACFLAVFSFCWLRVWMVSRLDTSRFKAILDLLPGDWKRFSPVDMEWLVTFAGRISLAWDEPIVVFSMTIWAIARGSDVVSGELNRGTMEMLLAQPVSRMQVLWSQVAVTVFGVVAIASAAWLGTWLGVQLNDAREEVPAAWHVPLVEIDIPLPWKKTEIRFSPMRDKVDTRVFLPASVNFGALGVFWAGLTTLVSACDRYRWRTIGIVVGFYVIELALKLLGMAASDWSWLCQLSIFTIYEPEACVNIATTSPSQTWSIWMDHPAGGLKTWGPMGYDLLMLGLGGLAFQLAAVIFHRRDLPAPL